MFRLELHHIAAVLFNLYVGDAGSETDRNTRKRCFPFLIKISFHFYVKQFIYFVYILLDNYKNVFF